MDQFSAIRIFLAVMDNGSFVEAAGKLGSDPSSISKAVSRLENELNCQLFSRTTRSIRPTEAGNKFAITARNILTELEECKSSLNDDIDAPKGRLRLNLPTAYGTICVVPTLADFCRKYPEIELDLCFSDDYLDMIENGFDLSIRTGTVTDSRLVMKQLSKVYVFTCASQDYLDNSEPIREYNDLLRHKWIRYRYVQTGKLMPEYIQDRDGNPTTLNVGNHVVVDDAGAAINLCCNGIGIFQAVHFLLKDELSSGRLTPIFPPLHIPNRGAFILYPKRQFLPAKVRCFISHMETMTKQMNDTLHQSWATQYGNKEP